VSKRLLFVIHYPVFGGPHNQALRLDAPLRARGWETTVLLPQETGNAAIRLREAGVEVVQSRLHRARATADPRLLGSWILGLPGDTLRLSRIMREREIDLVMFCGPINLQPAFAARRLPLPVVCQILDTRTPPFLRRLLMPIVCHLSHAVLVTGVAVAGAHDGLTALGDRLVTYFPPVNTAVFAPSTERRCRARSELGIDQDATVIGTIGNLNPQKDHLTFVRAAASVRRSHPNTVFLLLGAEYPNHVDYSKAVRLEAARLGMRLGIDLLIVDPGPRVPELAAALDIFWLTSRPRSEGLPTALGEAMALGLPIVATDVGGVREMVRHDETGFVVPPLDPRAIAAATVALLDDPARRVSMGRQSVILALQQFDPSTCANAHVRAFDLAIAKFAADNPEP
jgi:glycosyltransferase involved in cell wall biosynthesis